MPKALVVGLLAVIALLVLVDLVAFRLGHQGVEETAFQKELPDATPVQIGPLTEKQRFHSKLYTHYQLMRQGQGTIIDIAKQAKGKIIGTTVLPGLGPLLKPETPEKYFGALANSSDAIIRGKATKKISQITEDGGISLYRLRHLRKPDRKR